MTRVWFVAFQGRPPGRDITTNKSLTGYACHTNITTISKFGGRINHQEGDMTRKAKALGGALASWWIRGVTALGPGIELR